MTCGNSAWDRVRAGVTALTWLRMYASLTERDGRRIFWYNDRKQFVLGKIISDDWLADMTVPTGFGGQCDKP